MTVLKSAPGPAAEEAFGLGLVAATTAALAGLGLLLRVGLLTLPTVFLASILGVPVLLIVVSCLLGVWLGYEKDAVDTVLS